VLLTKEIGILEPSGGTLRWFVKVGWTADYPLRQLAQFSLRPGTTKVPEGGGDAYKKNLRGKQKRLVGRRW